MGLGVLTNHVLRPFGLRLERLRPDGDAPAPRQAFVPETPGGTPVPVPSALVTPAPDPPALGITAQEMAALVARLTRGVDARGNPNTHPLAVGLREVHTGLWNTKVMGSALARMLYAEGRAGPGTVTPQAPVHAGLGSRVCRQADIESDWLRHWCGALNMHPVYHRKVWEDCYVPQAIWEAGLLIPGKRALGFAVGAECLPSFFASRGLEVFATDLASTDPNAQGWQATNQHAQHLNDIYKADLVDRGEFERLVTFGAVDMNHIPPELAGGFDICWSVCSLEHLGSIENGLKFIENSMRCLRPGGIAVHTTEYNLQSDHETIDNWGTVLFQRRHVSDLRDRLLRAGHEMLAFDDAVGDGIMDMFVDVPPFDHQPRSKLTYPAPPHLRVSIDGFAATSVGIIVRAGG